MSVLTSGNEKVFILHAMEIKQTKTYMTKSEDGHMHSSESRENYTRLGKGSICSPIPRHNWVPL